MAPTRKRRGHGHEAPHTGRKKANPEPMPSAATNNHHQNKNKNKPPIHKDAGPRKNPPKSLQMDRRKHVHTHVAKDASLEHLALRAQISASGYERAGGDALVVEKVDKQVENISNIHVGENSKKAFMKEFQKVVDAANVILEVLDARDPLGCRCFDAEKYILGAPGSKRIILILNKVDLVPKEVAEKWLDYLRNDFPTIPFRASLQIQREKVVSNFNALNATVTSQCQCLGSEDLIQLLKNYSRNKNIKTSISVGVIGYPNTGKSSIVNSLKRSRAVNVGSTPGVTKTIQEVHLDKNIRLIDSPGIVFSSIDAPSNILRNCIRVEQIPDPVSPIDAIIQRCGSSLLARTYELPDFQTTAEFLGMIATLKGKLTKGGVLHLEDAARSVLRDWNSGKIPFFTKPPQLQQHSITTPGSGVGEEAPPASRDNHAQVVSEWAKEFSLDDFESKQASKASDHDVHMTSDELSSSYIVFDSEDYRSKRNQSALLPVYGIQLKAATTDMEHD